MFGLNQVDQPPAVPVSEIKLLGQLVDLLSDAKAAKARIAEFAKAGAAAQAAIEHAAKDTVLQPSCWRTPKPNWRLRVSNRRRSAPTNARLMSTP